MLGAKEAEAQAVSVRSRAKGDEGVMPFAQYLERVKHEVATRALPIRVSVPELNDVAKDGGKMNRFKRP